MTQGHKRGVAAAKNPNLVQSHNPYPEQTFEYKLFDAGRDGKSDPNVVAPITYTIDQLHPR